MTFRVHGYAFLALLALMFFSPASAPTPLELGQKIALQTEDSLFNYDFWMLDSSWLKLQISALGAPRFSDSVAQRQSVLQTLDLIRRMDEVDAEIEKIYTDPVNAADPQAASA